MYGDFSRLGNLFKENRLRSKEASLKLVNKIEGSHRITRGAAQEYDAGNFANQLREMNVTPHIAARKHTKSIDSRIIQHEGYIIYQRIRMRDEEKEIDETNVFYYENQNIL